MRVVDHHQRLAHSADQLHATLRRRKPPQHRRQLVEGDAAREQGAGDRDQVGDVEVRHHAHADLGLAPFPDEGEAQPRRRGLQAVGAQHARAGHRVGIGRIERAGDHRAPRGDEPARQRQAPGVVDVDHAGRQLRALEQARLGLGVGFHGAVVVEVVAAQVGEDRDVELRTIDPPLVEPDRGHLHRRRHRPLVAEAGEPALQLERVGRGVEALLERIGEAAAERADDAAGLAEIAERTREHLRDGGLAVGAGDARQPQRLRRPAVELVREVAGKLAQAAHAKTRHRKRGSGKTVAVFPQHSGHATRGRIGKETATIGTLAGPGREHAARPRPARIRADVVRVHPERAQAIEHGEGLRGAHMFSLPTPALAASSAPRRASWSGVSGMSGATPSVRSVPSVMRENTGAATVPP